MSLRRDVDAALQTLAIQQTLQGQQLKVAQESIAELAAAVRELQARLGEDATR